MKLLWEQEMRYIICFFCLVIICFIIPGCDPSGKDGGGSTTTTTSSGSSGETYTATIKVVNNDSEEYRLVIGTSDDLYDAVTELALIEEGEVVIESIPAGTESDPYELDLGTNESLAKDWLVQYNVGEPFGWSYVICTPKEDADGYVFEGDESYTITIVSTALTSIQKDAVK
jgi:hypothetical protein